MSTERKAAPLAVWAALFLTAAAPTMAADGWGYVLQSVGPNLVLDDGTLVRLAGGTRVVRADGSALPREQIGRGSRLEISYAADGTAAEVRVQPPTLQQRVYLSNLAPQRGAACSTTVAGRSRAVVLLRATYARPANWTQLVSEVRYDPRGAAGAPAAARFLLKDSFGDVLAERVVGAGQTALLSIGLDAGTTDRVSFEAAPAGDGQLEAEWCAWLDPYLGATPPNPTPGAAYPTRGAERLVAALAKALGETRVDGLAVCEFTPVRANRDQFYLRDLAEDLMVLLGRTFRLAGAYRTRLPVGAPIPDGNRDELKKLGAGYVLTGSVSARAEGTVLNALIVQVENGALMAAASVDE
jgi:TolB-like protein